jgi:hypothetical protein
MVPKNIYMMWDRPRSEWPPIVRMCVDMWIEFNPDFQVEIFDAASAWEYLSEDFDKAIYDSLKIQHQADLLRTKLLALRGGIWVDATCMPHMPVRSWIDNFEGTDFAGIQTLTLGQTIDNWFMLSRADSLLMRKQYDKLKSYWRTSKINLPQDEISIDMIAKKWRYFISEFAAHDLRIAPYFLWQYIFTLQIEEDQEFAECFKLQPYVSPPGACGYISHQISLDPSKARPLAEDLRNCIIKSDAPLSKLVRHIPPIPDILDELRECVMERRKIEGF